MHYQVKIRQAVGSLLKLFLRTNAIAATKQVGYGMGQSQKHCSTQPQHEALMTWLSTLKYPQSQVLNLFVENKNGSLTWISVHLNCLVFVPINFLNALDKLELASINQHTLFCVISDSMPRILTVTSVIKIRRHRKMPATLAICGRSVLLFKFKIKKTVGK